MERQGSDGKVGFCLRQTKVIIVRYMVGDAMMRGAFNAGDAAYILQGRQSL